MTPNQAMKRTALPVTSFACAKEPPGWRPSLIAALGVMHHRFLYIAISLTFSVVESHASDENVDITTYFGAMITCIESNVPASGSLVEKFSFAWTACEYERRALVEAAPEEERPYWEARLEETRTSFLAQYETQEAQEGYGLSEDNPILIGGLTKGPSRVRAYFSRLRTTRGDPVAINRIGSCCHFETPNHPVEGGLGLLDKYEMTVFGTDETIDVYVNIYDEGPARPVEGFFLVDPGEKPL